jgi:hypothetical protein
MNGLTGGNRGPWRAVALAHAAAVAVLTTACGHVHVHFGSSAGSAPTEPPVEEVGDTEVVHALAPGAVIREVLIPSSYTVTDVALSIRQDTTRYDRGTGQLEAGS